MPNPMLNARAGRTGGLGRTHNYQAMYEPDPEGQEASENARIWKVYLDEADTYDADMVDSFRTILDSLLVFASLFSAVVTTFVAQTSQVLQPDSGQIAASLLIETNQLLRAAGNTTKIDAVALSPLGPNSIIYTSKDVWVNGLFFTSLALSVTTALLTVLAKQWVQAYIEVVPGNARTQARIRQFRFDGLVKWKLGTIIEGLPLILHSSVAIFLIGLSLYVSQISRPICAILSFITAATFIFYLGTSMIPAFYIDCPFRISSMFFVARSLWIILQTVLRVLYNWVAKTFPSMGLAGIPFLMSFLSPPNETWRKEEYLYARESHLDWKSCSWLFGHSTNNSTKDIVLEGVLALLDELERDDTAAYFVYPPIPSVSLLLDLLIYSVHRQSDLEERSKSGDMANAFITKFLLIGPTLPDLAPIPVEQRPWPFPNWKAFEIDIWKRCVAAWREENYAISKCCRTLIQRYQMDGTIRSYILNEGNQDDVHCAMDDDSENLSLRFLFEETGLHDAATWGNLEALIAFHEANPELINATRSSPPRTAVECAISPNAWIEFDPQIVEYLLDHGASVTPYTLHFAVDHHRSNPDAIKFLLDRGWDRTAKDQSGATPIDLAHARTAEYHSGVRILDYLENYQTVPLPHPSMLTTPTTRLEDIEIPTNAHAMPLGQGTSVNDRVVEAGNDSVDIQVIPRDEGTSVEAKTGVWWKA